MKLFNVNFILLFDLFDHGFFIIIIEMCLYLNLQNIRLFNEKI